MVVWASPASSPSWPLLPAGSGVSFFAEAQSSLERARPLRFAPPSPSSNLPRSAKCRSTLCKAPGLALRHATTRWNDAFTLSSALCLLKRTARSSWVSPFFKGIAKSAEASAGDAANLRATTQATGDGRAANRNGGVEQNDDRMTTHCHAPHTSEWHWETPPPRYDRITRTNPGGSALLHGHTKLYVVANGIHIVRKGDRATQRHFSLRKNTHEAHDTLVRAGQCEAAKPGPDGSHKDHNSRTKRESASNAANGPRRYSVS